MKTLRRFLTDEGRAPAKWNRFPWLEYVLVLAIMIVLAITLGTVLGAQG